MYAIIRDRGSQYRVAEGEVVQLDLMPGKKDGEAVEFSDVLLTSSGGGEVSVGTPLVDGVKVSGTVVGAEVKGKKIDVVHFRRRKDSITKRGHRQRYTHVKIDSISGCGGGSDEAPATPETEG